MSLSNDNNIPWDPCQHYCSPVWETTSKVLKQKWRHVDKIFATIWTGSCQDLNSRKEFFDIGYTINCQDLNSQKTPHSLPSKASYGVSFVSLSLDNLWCNQCQKYRQHFDICIEVGIYTIT